MQKRKTRIIAIAIIIATIFITNKTYATEADISSNFVDENLRNAILDLAKETAGDEEKTAIYESDIDKIIEMPGGTSLKLAGKGIKDLSGIEIFANKGITWIFLDWNELTDLSPLANLQTLTKISFSGNEVTDLTPLGNLENLQNLTAINNKISSIEPLKNLKNMKYICLDGNNLSDISGIQNWNDLVDMSFQNNQIEELPNLSGLTKLQSCNLSNNKIKTINNIPEIENLEKLEIDNNELISLEGIQNLANLKILSCSNNQIEELDGLVTLTNLRNLNINKNKIQNIEKLEQNAQIEYLYMDNNAIQDFETLRQLSNLKKYSIYNQNIAVEIKEKIIEEYVLIPLPSLYSSLYDEASFIYKNDITTKVTGAQEYEIDASNQNIKLKAADLKQNDITVEVVDNNNTLLNYHIQLDKVAPTIEGITNNQIYFEPVTPICQDDDINEVILIKDEQTIQYNLGTSINEKGKYTLTVTDRAGNETTINFEIKSEIEQGEEYKIEENYIIGITHNTNLQDFDKNLNGNVPYKIYREEEQLGEAQIVATGDKLVTQYNKIFYLIVKGDVTKDGNINIKDLVKIRKKLLKIEQLDEFQEKAADIANDQKITIKDLVQIRKIIISNSI